MSVDRAKKGEPGWPRVTARLVLASASPRRRALLDELGLHAEVQRPPAEAEQEAEVEADQSGADLGARVALLATRKAEAVAARLSGPWPAWVLAADTLGALDGEILGKPRDAAHAEAMLRTLAGRTHEVATGVIVLRVEAAGIAARAQATDITHVHFLPIPPETIRAYVATGEPLDKAAAYGVQGAAGAWVDHIEGSWSNVVGLPMHLVPRLLAATDHPLPAHLRTHDTHEIDDTHGTEGAP